MAPPLYADLGKQSRDLFAKNYHFGLVKLDFKTKTKTGVEFVVNGTSLNDTGKVNASLETKYKISEYGVTLREKWNTDNQLNTELTCEDAIAKGLKVSCNATFAPQTGKKNAILQTCYKMDNCHFNADVDVNAGSPLLTGAGVLHCQGWLAGIQLGMDAAQNKLTKSNFALGYTTDEFTLHTHVNDGQQFGGSIFQKVNDKLQTGITLSWTSGTNQTQFGFGCVYNLDQDTSFRCKVNNVASVGLGFTHRLKDGIEMTLSAAIDGKNFNQGGHKLGLGINLEA